MAEREIEITAHWGGGQMTFGPNDPIFNDFKRDYDAALRIQLWWFGNKICPRQRHFMLQMAADPTGTIWRTWDKAFPLTVPTRCAKWITAHSVCPAKRRDDCRCVIGGLTNSSVRLQKGSAVAKLMAVGPWLADGDSAQELHLSDEARAAWSSQTDDEHACAIARRVARELGIPDLGDLGGAVSCRVEPHAVARSSRKSPKKGRRKKKRRRR